MKSSRALEHIASVSFMSSAVCSTVHRITKCEVGQITIKRAICPAVKRGSKTISGNPMHFSGVKFTIL